MGDPEVVLTPPAPLRAMGVVASGLIAVSGGLELTLGVSLPEPWLAVLGGVVAGTGVVLAVRAWRLRVRLTADALEIRGYVRSRAIARAEILTVSNGGDVTWVDARGDHSARLWAFWTSAPLDSQQLAPLALQTSVQAIREWLSAQRPM